MMNGRRLVTAALVLMMTLPATARGETLTVGVEDLDYLPHYGMRDGLYTGFGRDLLDAFAADQGISLTYKPYPVERLFLTFLQGGVDLKYPDNAQWKPQDKQAHAIAYSAPVVPYIDGTLVMPGHVGRGPEALKRLGTVRGFTPWDWLGRLKAGTAALNEVNGLDPLLQLVTLERIDGAYANVDVVRGRLAAQGRPNALVFDPGLPHSSGHYHLSTIRRPDVIARFDAWLAAHQPRVKELRQIWRLDSATGS